MHEDKTEEIEKAVKDVADDYDIIAAYLYGSYHKNEMNHDSDVDIAIVFRDFKMNKLLELSRKLDEKISIGRDLDIRALNDSGLRFQFEVLKDSKVLFEKNKYERADYEQEVARKYHDMKPSIEMYRRERKKRLVKNG